MELPLFPLHTVLCPGIVMPLHVFEERYRALTRHCLETGGPFGIVLIRQGREVGAPMVSLAPIGGLAEIREAGRYADGRYDLLVAGTGRFALESIDIHTAPYLVGEVTRLDDEVGDEARAERLSAVAIRRFVRYLELLRARAGETEDPLDIRVEVDSGSLADDGGGLRSNEDSLDDPELTDVGVEASRRSGAADPDEDEAEKAEAGTGASARLLIPDDPTTLSFLLSGIVQVELPRRQRLLEAETTEDRLIDLTGLLDREIVLLQRRLRFYSPDPDLVSARRS
ncbi:MAG: LON peptidase substrate-binding domain-containing protein [Chloroflexi bacterium]|nr:LON peptidase substrate-binding domain-containing protein [Chloroflexota bacterium]